MSASAERVNGWELPCHRQDAAQVLPPVMVGEQVRRWTLWGDGKGPGKDGKLNKKPHAEADRREKWGAYSEVIAAARRSAASGVGYQLLDSKRLLGIDLDGVVRSWDRGSGQVELVPRGQIILDAIPETYAEVSPSGRGLRIFCLRPPGFDLTGDTTQKLADGVGVEVYTGRGARYLTVTGWVLPGREGKLAELQMSALDVLEREGVKLKRGAPTESGAARGQQPDLPEITAWQEHFFPGGRWKRLGQARRALLLGNVPEGERSELVASLIASELGQHTAEEVYQLLLSAPGTKAYLSKHSDPRAFAWEEITRAKGLLRKPKGADLIDRLQKLNEQYAVVDEGGRMFVITSRPDENFEGRERLVRYTFNAFREKLQPEQHRIVTDSSVTTEYLSDRWLNWEKRRQYEGITFDPSGRAPARFYNLWRGWAVAPAPGDWSMFRDHILRVICDGSTDLDRYVIGWLAFLVQHPEERPETALVLRGREGTGKSLFGQAVRALAGQHGFQVSNARHLVGNFNAHLQNTLVLQADEAFFAGDRGHISVLKSIITDPEIVIEGKGRDSILSRNRLHVIMTSNEEWVVPASLDARRFAVIDVSARRKGDKSYFGELVAHVRKEATLAAMLYDLGRISLAGFDVREVPKTAALEDQKIRSLDGLKAWLVDLLNGGGLPSGFGSAWRPFYSTDELHRSYVEWMNGQRRWERALPRNIFGRELGLLFEAKRECPAADRAPDVAEGVRGFRFGPLEEAQVRFCDKTGLGRSLFEDGEDLLC